MIGISHEYPVLRIELLHCVFLTVLLLFLVPVEILEPWGLLVGGVFMGVNFLFLSLGVWALLTPFSGKRRIRAGVLLLMLKLIFFLGLVSLLFFRVPWDLASFAVGVSCLLAAIVAERVWAFSEVGE